MLTFPVQDDIAPVRHIRGVRRVRDRGGSTCSEGRFLVAARLPNPELMTRAMK